MSTNLEAEHPNLWLLAKGTFTPSHRNFSSIFGNMTARETALFSQPMEVLAVRFTGPRPYFRGLALHFIQPASVELRSIPQIIAHESYNEVGGGRWWNYLGSTDHIPRLNPPYTDKAGEQKLYYCFTPSPSNIYHHLQEGYDFPDSMIIRFTLHAFVADSPYRVRDYASEAKDMVELGTFAFTRLVRKRTLYESLVDFARGGSSRYKF
jgi:hypothetical protein